MLSTGPLVDRRARRPLFVAVSLGCAAALAAVGPDVSFARAVVCLFALGACLGGYETILNTAIAERYAERAARPLTLVHTGATLGAVLGAPLSPGSRRARACAELRARPPPSRSSAAAFAV